MRQTLDPDFEFQRGPVLGAAAAIIVVGLVANFVLMRPGWIGWGAILAGIVASLLSGYYESSGNNAAVGVMLGVLLLTPVLVYFRITFMFDISGGGDTIFTAIALGGGWLTLALLFFATLGYISAVASDFTRRKVGGPIGY